MISLVPTFPDPFYDLIVTLEGTDYKMTWNYDQREDCYYLSLATPDGTDLVNGIKVISSWPLLHKWAWDGLPPGELIVVPMTQNDSPPGLGQIGPNKPYQLLYFDSSQLP